MPLCLVASIVETQVFSSIYLKGWEFNLWADQPLRAGRGKKTWANKWVAHAFSVNSKIDLWRDAPHETQGAEPEPLGCVANGRCVVPIVRESWECGGRNTVERPMPSWRAIAWALQPWRCKFRPADKLTVALSGAVGFFASVKMRREHWALMQKKLPYLKLKSDTVICPR